MAPLQESKSLFPMTALQILLSHFAEEDTEVQGDELSKKESPASSALDPLPRVAPLILVAGLLSSSHRGENTQERRVGPLPGSGPRTYTEPV